MGRQRESSIVIAAFILAFLLLRPEAAWAQQQPTPADVVAYIIRDGPVRGNEKAPVTLIEFSDFQCSFCWRFWRETLPLINEKYIQTGRVRFLYQHFAILGKPSTLAAQAVECANEQGKFWPYHDKLFSQTPTPLAFTEVKLKEYGKELGLEAGSFNPCVETAKYANKVEAETAMTALLGIRGTPAFLLNEQFLAGAQPFNVFAAAIENELKKAAKPAPRSP
ncbi:MAG: DsbA family protein [Candidatus Binatia bacterium]